MINQLREFEGLSDLVLTEAKKPGANFAHFRVRALKLDCPTSNGRVYKKALIEREIKRLMQSPTSVFGAPYHPDKAAEVPDVSHIVDKLEVGRDGYLWAEGTILPTTKGKDLKIILDAGGKLGLSVRGVGSVDPKTGAVDEESYRLRSVDIVTNPASEGAELTKANIFESAQLEREAADEFDGEGLNGEQQKCAEVFEAFDAALGKTGRLRPLVEKELADKTIPETAEGAVEMVEEAKGAVQFVINEAVRQKIVESAGNVGGGIGICPDPNERDIATPFDKRAAQAIREARLSGSNLSEKKIIEALNK